MGSGLRAAMRPHPLFVSEARGAHVWDLDGDRYIDRHGVVLIYDEVIAGFRIARGGAAERFGVRPDLSVFGKAMAGGFTQSAVVGRADLIDQVTDGVVRAGTFNGNPVALAAVQAAMGALKDPSVYETLENVSARFERVIGDLLAATPRVARLKRVGSLVFMPPGKNFLSTAHRQTDIDATAEALERVLRQVRV
ncbi:aminotransferase class III-fold pyridoxal phosphate-dependent enzyme [Streptomyces sp. E-08]|uniref:aminotransferase class III-fold pyridoxal phosphate-dependent enzyme n=1 Tax=Streptomyces sp. E-08 TaxID=3404047 RepID=UPI003CF33AFD